MRESYERSGRTVADNVEVGASIGFAQQSRGRDEDDEQRARPERSRGVLYGRHAGVSHVAEPSEPRAIFRSTVGTGTA